MSSKYLAVVITAATLLMNECTSVQSIKNKYEQGDESQLEVLMQIVSNSQYPYSTRKKAVAALGEIGEIQAVPVLINALYDPDPRDGLEKEAIRALGMIGCDEAVGALARVLDTNRSLRVDAIRALGQIGGRKSAEVLINALKYYAKLAEQKGRRELLRGPGGFYSSEDSSVVLGGGEQRGQVMETSVRKRRKQTVPGGFFSGDMPFTIEEDEEEEEKQMEEVVKALVASGPEAIPALTDALNEKLKPGDADVKEQLTEILKQIMDGQLPQEEGQKCQKQS